MPQPFIPQLEQVVAHFAFQQDLTHQNVQGHRAEHKVIQRLVSQQRDLVQGSVPSHKEKHSHQAARSQRKAYGEADGQKDQQHNSEQKDHFATSPAAAAGS